jgi:hypothetical protein
VTNKQYGGVASSVNRHITIRLCCDILTQTETLDGVDLPPYHLRKLKVKIEILIISESNRHAYAYKSTLI